MNYLAHSVLSALAIVIFAANPHVAYGADDAAVPDPKIATAISLDVLFDRDWKHSYEEEKQGSDVQIYRDAKTKKFERSRFRMSYKFQKNGICEWLWLSPTDRHRMKSGKWTLDSNDQHLIHIIDEEGKIINLKIVSLTDDMLQIKAVK